MPKRRIEIAPLLLLFTPFCSPAEVTYENVGDNSPKALPTTIMHKPGVREARAGTVTITDVRSNKARYDENEKASTMATLVNTSGREQSGTLIALMHLDLDTTREIARTAFTIGAGESKGWTFSYSVGPETYGRGLEVQFVDATGNAVDSWQEFYAVAAEYFRVHQHTYHAANDLYAVNPWSTYLTQRHYFASEPTDFGVHKADAEQYVSGQAGYRVHQAGRRAEMDYYKTMGVDSSFYQTWAFSGQMGYEEMRKHPEYALYDENGQFAVDPIYGSYPNPMELASPVEVGPKRKAKRHLDLPYRPWQHCAANLAMAEAVVYQANCVRAYAAENGFTGVYVDGNMGVLKGYSYDGTPNVPSGRPEEYARLNARNHRLFSAILKRGNPNFGTWYNWSYDGVKYCVNQGITSAIGSGTGTKGDAGDASIRAATEWKNVMLLSETGSFYGRFKPGEFLDMLIRQRDWAVQKFGANTLVGYSDSHLKGEEPGATRWGWPTINYLGAQLIATQMHFADAFMPSHRPTLQFMTRYSRFLWSPDVKVIPEGEKVVEVSSPEELWWKRLVYRRRTAEGCDVIAHLVRIPPTKQWDIQLADEPAPLDGVTVTVNIGSGSLLGVLAMRPYHYEEDQQPVQTVLRVSVQNGKAQVRVPPFRYHTMVVFQVKEAGATTAGKRGTRPASPQSRRGKGEGALRSGPIGEVVGEKR